MLTSVCSYVHNDDANMLMFNSGTARTDSFNFSSKDLYWREGFKDNTASKYNLSKIFGHNNM